MAVADLAPLAEERVRLVEEQYGVACFCAFEYPGQVLLGLPDVLAHDSREIYLVQVQPEIPRYNVGGHGLARAGRASEQDVESPAERQLTVEAPLVVDNGAIPHVVANLSELAQLIRRQDDVLPLVVRRQLARQCAEVSRGMSARCGKQVVLSWLRVQRPPALCRSPRRPAARGRDSGSDLGSGEAESTGQGIEGAVFDHLASLAKAVSPVRAPLYVARQRQRHIHNLKRGFAARQSGCPGT